MQRILHCKKRLIIFQSPARISLTKLSQDGINYSRPIPSNPVLGEFGKWYPGWGRGNGKPFFTVYYPMGRLMPLNWDVLQMGCLEIITCELQYIWSWVTSRRMGHFIIGPFVIWDVSVWDVLSRVRSGLGHFVQDRRYCNVDHVKLPPSLLFHSATCKQCKARPNSVGGTTLFLLFLSGLK